MLKFLTSRSGEVVTLVLLCVMFLYFSLSNLFFSLAFSLGYGFLISVISLLAEWKLEREKYEPLGRLAALLLIPTLFPWLKFVFLLVGQLPRFLLVVTIIAFSVWLLSDLIASTVKRGVIALVVLPLIAVFAVFAQILAEDAVSSAMGMPSTFFPVTTVVLAVLYFTPYLWLPIVSFASMAMFIYSGWQMVRLIRLRIGYVEISRGYFEKIFNICKKRKVRGENFIPKHVRNFIGTILIFVVSAWLTGVNHSHFDNVQQFIPTIVQAVDFQSGENLPGLTGDGRYNLYREDLTIRVTDCDIYFTFTVGRYGASTGYKFRYTEGNSVALPAHRYIDVLGFPLDFRSYPDENSP